MSSIKVIIDTSDLATTAAPAAHAPQSRYIPQTEFVLCKSDGTPVPPPPGNEYFDGSSPVSITISTNTWYVYYVYSGVKTQLMFLLNDGGQFSFQSGAYGSNPPPWVTPSTSPPTLVIKGVDVPVFFFHPKTPPLGGSPPAVKLSGSLLPWFFGATDWMANTGPDYGQTLRLIPQLPQFDDGYGFGAASGVDAKFGISIDDIGGVTAPANSQNFALYITIPGSSTKALYIWGFPVGFQNYSDYKVSPLCRYEPLAEGQYAMAPYVQNYPPPTGVMNLVPATGGYGVLINGSYEAYGAHGFGIDADVNGNPILTANNTITTPSMSVFGSQITFF
jgi:hypothetical protein